MAIVIEPLQTSEPDAGPLDGSGVFDDFALVESLRAARRKVSQANARQLVLLAELQEARVRAAGPWGCQRALESVVDEVAAALTLTTGAAVALLSMASKLATVLPLARAALTEGRLDLERVRVICEGVFGLPHQTAGRVEAALFPEAEQLTTGQLRNRIKALVMKIDPEAFAERRQRIVRGRRVELWSNENGTMDLAGRDLPDTEASAAANRVWAIAAARKTDGDERPIDAIRADVYLELLLGRALATGGPSAFDTTQAPPPAPIPERSAAQTRCPDKPEQPRSTGGSDTDAATTRNNPTGDIPDQLDNPAGRPGSASPDTAVRRNAAEPTPDRPLHPSDPTYAAPTDPAREARAEPCTGACAEPCAEACTGVCAETCTEACAGACAEACAEPCAEARAEPCAEPCTEACAGACTEAYAAVRAEDRAGDGVETSVEGRAGGHSEARAEGRIEARTEACVEGCAGACAEDHAGLCAEGHAGACATRVEGRATSSVETCAEGLHGELAVGQMPHPVSPMGSINPTSLLPVGSISPVSSVDWVGAVGDAAAVAARGEAREITERACAELTALFAGMGGRDGKAKLVAAEAGRRIAAALADLKTTWCTHTTNERGDTVHGHHGYRPPAGMRRHVQQRDLTCRFPTCNRPATWADLDHTIAYHQDGPSCPCNLAALCRRHHRLKQDPGWELIQLWPGVLLWISPTGHWYLATPDDP